MLARRAVLVLPLVLAASAALFAKNGAGHVLIGKVVGVTDGDTITVLDENQEQRKVRLAGIDAPEKKQAFGTKAREALAAKVFGKDVDIQVTDIDRYGLTFGYVYVHAPDPVNMELVREGFAWRYPQYDKRGVFTEAEKDAREHKRGLWADPHPIPPWEFRRAKREGRSLE
jgi:micrococcal nuclease